MTRTRWTSELIAHEIKRCMAALEIDRMPTANEFRNVLNREDLHNAICRSKKYSGWADELGLPMKDGETRRGNLYEKIIGERLENLGFKVEQMTTKHPYDLLVNDAVKVDVKVANMYTAKDGSEFWAFHLAKEKPTCDVYILVAKPEGPTEERVYVIPSQFVNMKTVSIGRETKYDLFRERFDFINMFSEFYEEIDDLVGVEWDAI